MVTDSASAQMTSILRISSGKGHIDHNVRKSYPSWHESGVRY